MSAPSSSPLAPASPARRRMLFRCLCSACDHQLPTKSCSDHGRLCLLSVLRSLQENSADVDGNRVHLLLLFLAPVKRGRDLDCRLRLSN
eukprot:1022680-Rhodomonas_salina.1